MAQPPGRDVSALEVRRNVMVKDFLAQHQQHDAAFELSMKAIEKKATLEHIQRETDVAVVLQRITMQYDDAAAQRRARWTAAEQLMREASTVRENRRTETANAIEQGHQLTAVNTLEDWTSAARQGIAQLEETAIVHLNELSARLAAVLSSSSIKRSASMGDTRDAGYSLRLPSRSMQNIFPLESIHMLRPLQPMLDNESDVPAGNVRYTREEPPSVTEMATSEPRHRIQEQQPTHPPPQYDTTSFSKLSKQMEAAFAQAQAIRHDKYIAIQSRFNDMIATALDQPFASKRVRLNRLFQDFLRRSVVVAAEDVRILAIAGAVARFKAMERSRSALYAQSCSSIISTLEKAVARIMRRAETIESRMLQAGLLKLLIQMDRAPKAEKSAPHRRPFEYGPSSSTAWGVASPMPPAHMPASSTDTRDDDEPGRVPESRPSRHSAPSQDIGATPVTVRHSAILDTEPQRFYAAQADRTTRFDESQAAHLDDSAACEARRKAIFEQIKERQCDDALQEETKRWFEFEDALAGVRGKWQAREVARAETFEDTIEELRRLFHESQEERSSRIQAAVDDADNACRAAVEKATRALGAFIDAIAKNGFASSGIGVEASSIASRPQAWIGYDKPW
ncbi:hypothetical protein EXIGLDRAFT_753764 [Exidia glandulosa HHB12029]|uniref:Uncharacterized protein n=1 Tax=Exidia glandulosa HHB12029 TaxID=1314781 RepID=A0A165DHR3_EXIGL|nr:hypothetical protein EXIGLDRAFT_753764 [Exidia glandulosa HHB12029]